MDYNSFITLRKEGKIKAGIDTSVALKLIDSLPKRYRFTHYFWSWIWILTIPVCILLAIFIKWWLGLILILTVTPGIYKVVKISAVQFVLEHATDNEDFFNKLVEDDLLEFQKKNNHL